jgi:hypothetical protein
MWPCNSVTKTGPNSKNSKFVSKVVSKSDEESKNLLMAAEILGPKFSRYLAGLYGECRPSSKYNPPASKNMNSLQSTERALIAWPKKGQACGDLRQKIMKGDDISKDSKIMFISKYEATVSTWAEKLKNPYKITIQEVEDAIPQFLVVLQKLYEGENKLIHIDLHTGNIFIRTLQRGIEFGIADFGHCVFRRNGVDPSQTFYGGFLIDHLAKYEFYSGYSQVPLEARLFNYCYKKQLDSVKPVELVRSWESNSEVRLNSVGSTDFISSRRSQILAVAIKKILFIAMIEQIQSICRKMRNTDSTKLYQSLNNTEKVVVEFILTRYSVLSPINTINEELMNVYQEPLVDSQGVGTNKLCRFLMIAILAPYTQDGSSLSFALKSVEEADMGIIWADV